MWRVLVYLASLVRVLALQRQKCLRLRTLRCLERGVLGVPPFLYLVPPPFTRLSSSTTSLIHVFHFLSPGIPRSLAPTGGGRFQSKAMNEGGATT
jgi:hypothetical protein